jgi:hypothetical protein
MRSFVRPALLAGIIVSTAAGVVACGGGSGSTSSSSSSSVSAVASSRGTNSDGGRTGQRNDPFADPTVAQCLKAAGIAVPTFTRPSGTFTRPSGTFSRPSGTFSRPSGSFTRPSGATGGGFGGGFGTDSPEFAKIQQALTACGITLPTGGARGGGGGGAGGAGGAAQPSGAPTN